MPHTPQHERSLRIYTGSDVSTACIGLLAALDRVHHSRTIGLNTMQIPIERQAAVQTGYPGHAEYA